MTTFLRFDAPELDGTMLVVRATPAEVREGRRLDGAVPLGYLYQRTYRYDPVSDTVLAAGHYDGTGLVWVFSGDVGGIAGLTEPYSSDPPSLPMERRTDDVQHARQDPAPPVVVHDGGT